MDSEKRTVGDAFREAFEGIDDPHENKSIGIASGVDMGAIVQIFATHLELSLQHSHPEKAAEAAYAAVKGYLQSYSFIDTSTKDSPGPSWRQVPKRDTKTAGGG